MCQSFIFIRLNNIALYVYHILFIHPMKDIWVIFIFGTLLYKYLFDFLFSFLWSIYQECNYWTWQFYVYLFEESQYIFHSGCTILYPHQQYTRVSISSQHLCSPTLTFHYLIIAILVGINCYPTVTLIWISLMISNIDHLLCAHWPFVISSLEKCLLKYFASFWIGLLGFFWLFLHCRSSLCILDVNFFFLNIFIGV